MCDRLAAACVVQIPLHALVILLLFAACMAQSRRAHVAGMMDQLLISAILAGALFLFVQERIRADAVALIALLTCHVVGLLTVREALDGFSSRAVITVAAVLVIGRVIEVTGAAAALTRLVIPRTRFVTVQLGALLIVAVLLSAFMNNVAALVITMPAAMALARDHKLPQGALLMTLAFATVLGGMTTLIGTPGNLILSSVREDALGSPYRLFDMTLVGGTVAAAGLLYLLLFGWRLTPRRESLDRLQTDPVRVFELTLPMSAWEGRTRLADLRRELRDAGGVLLAVFRGGERVKLGADAAIEPDDRVLAMAKAPPWEFAAKTRFLSEHTRSTAADAIMARVTVAHGSPLIGKSYAEVPARSQDALRVVAVGPRPAREKKPLDTMRIGPGDQLFITGSEAAYGPFAHDMRLLEIDRKTLAPGSAKPALTALGIYALAVGAAAIFSLPVSIVFVAAALAMCLMRLIPSNQIYSAIDWPVIVLLGAMIPIGRAFHETGATDTVVAALEWALTGASMPVAVAVLCAATMILSSFLNNVATALVMGQVGVEAALAMGINVDAALLAVLVGSSCSFLTPIGHQNNLMVMRPGGYRFSDYAKVGVPLTIIVIIVTTVTISLLHGPAA